MKKWGFMVLTLTVLAATCLGQPSPPGMAEADLHFEQKRYASALPIYLDSFRRTTSNGNTYYKAGMCYLNSRSQKFKAAEFLEKAVSNSTSFYTKGFAKETDAPLDAFLYLGDAYHVNYDFDKAIASYQKYKEMLTSSKITDETKFKEADLRIEASSFARDLKANVGLPAIPDIPEYVKNGRPAGESTVELSPDKSTVIYTVKVPVNQLNKSEDERYFKPLVPEPAIKELKITKPERKKNEPDTIVNICTVGSSRNGQMVLTYHNDKGEANLYLTRLKENAWTDPVKLPKTSNAKGWEPGEYISADGRHLYFASDRKGGFGGKDIYRCEKLANGEWSIAVNLGPEINTPYNEEAPYLHADGVTLYFSSNRFKPAMSCDILATKTDGKTWSKPVMVGYPINSSEKDIFYQVSESKKTVLASADKNSIAEKEEVKPAEEEVKKKNKEKKSEEAKEVPSADNVFLSFEDPANLPAAMLLGEVKSQQGKVQMPLSASITVLDLQTQKPIGLFFSDRERGEYSFLLPTGKNAGIWYEAPGFLFASEHLNIEKDKTYFEKRKEIVLQPMAEDAVCELNNVFFGKDDASLTADSELELQKVYTLLKENPEMHVKITNYIYAPAKSLKKLSAERADALKTYLEQKGISKKRIKAKGVRESKLPGRSEKSGPPKPEDLEPVQKITLEITEIKNN